ncbi:DUF6484 domain-containing protein [Luteolibacter sp. Populi]|uniref:DUF6484 domain-containing protein n=1 Tax=Luteolibacter sp. Populi TaxID=3230487 RepID=UPI003466C432
MSEPRHLPSAVPMPSGTLATHGVAIGIFAGRDSEGRPCVSFPHASSAGVRSAAASCPLGDLKPGGPVAVMFIGGDPAQPVILGPVVFPPAGEIPWEIPAESADAPTAEPPSPEGEELTLNAEKKISLVCGKASITLTEAGKVIIRGTHLLSRATGANRIQGGSIELN